jgi:hypothetical protein
MSADALRQLSDRIGSAGPDAEAALFAEALPLFAAIQEEHPGWRRYLCVHAFHDLAVAIFTTQFPGWGFQFGTLAGTSPGSIANVWREGDAQSSLHHAATPALALLRAAATEAASALDARTAAQCPACDGRGWFVTVGARKQVCRHEYAAA